MFNVNFQLKFRV